jgi:hypothetical protein
MPWCESCAKFWSPNSLTPAGECPSCGHRFSTDGARSLDGDELAVDDYKAPWHFKLMVGMAVVYVVWRIMQMVSWII